MRSLLLFLIPALLSAQIAVQKNSSNVITNGNIVIGSGTTLTATGNGTITATNFAMPTITTTAPLTGGGPLTGNLTLAIPQATGSVDGYLTSGDWTTFNAKQPVITTSTDLSLAAISFNTTMTPAGAVGQLNWNTTDGTLDLGMVGGNVTLQIGQEQLLYAHNHQGSSLADGNVVYVDGSEGQKVTVRLAMASDEVHSTNTIGVVTEPISTNQSGFVTLSGLVRGINTQGYADGDPIWLSDVTAGAWTKTRPSGPVYNVLIGYVVKGGSVGAGSIFVNVQRIPNLTNAVQNRPLITRLVGGTTTDLDALPLTYLDSGSIVRLYLSGSIVADYRLRARVGGTEAAVAQWKVLSTVDTTKLWELVSAPVKQGVPGVWNPTTSKFHQILLSGSGTLILNGFASEADAFTLP